MSSKYNNIDDLFRDKFNSFEPEPPSHVWENIQERVGNSGSNGKPFTNGGIAGLTSVIIIAGLFTFLNLTGFQSGEHTSFINQTELSVSDDLLSVYQNTLETNQIDVPEQPVELNKKFENTTIEINDISETYSETVHTDVAGEEDEDVATFEIAMEEYSSINDTQAEEHIDNIENSEQEVEKPERDLLAMASDKDEVAVFTSKVSHSVIEDLVKETVQTNQFSVESNETTTVASLPAEPAEPGIRSDYGKRNNFLFGLHITPELTYYPEDDKYSNRSYSFDLSAIYQFSGYMLQSGLGLSWTKDDGNYAIDYEQYEFMGSYQDVYDITFDTVGGEIVPTYHTQEVEVYDSIQHVSISPTKYNYTYLQIPLLFGYGDEAGRISWFVKGGPNLSIMIYENRPEMNMPGTDINVLNVDNKLPTRIKANWQLIFSAGASYKLSNNLSFSVEPMLRYYIKSAYDRNNMQTKHPYSVGLRTGLLINF